MCVCVRTVGKFILFVISCFLWRFLFLLEKLVSLQPVILTIMLALRLFWSLRVADKCHYVDSVSSI